MFLVRVDPEKRMDRWYAISAQPTLFAPCCIVLRWGSRHTAYQRARFVEVADPVAADRLIAALVARKTRRGYTATHAR